MIENACSRVMPAEPGGYDAPWLVVYADGQMDGYPTMEAACAFQREWRRQHGRDPFTRKYKLTGALPP